MSVIFLSMPTKGAVEGGTIRADVLKMVARLHATYPHHVFISPMIHDYQLLPYLKTTATWQEWGDRCRALITRCDEVWVLMLDGWTKPWASPDDTYNTSEGVREEIKFARASGVQVVFVDPPHTEPTP